MRFQWNQLELIAGAISRIADNNELDKRERKLINDIVFELSFAINNTETLFKWEKFREACGVKQ